MNLKNKILEYGLNHEKLSDPLTQYTLELGLDYIKKHDLDTWDLVKHIIEIEVELGGYRDELYEALSGIYDKSRDLGIPDAIVRSILTIRLGAALASKAAGLELSDSIRFFKELLECKFNIGGRDEK